MTIRNLNTAYSNSVVGKTNLVPELTYVLKTSIPEMYKHVYDGNIDYNNPMDLNKRLDWLYTLLEGMFQLSALIKELATESGKIQEEIAKQQKEKIDQATDSSTEENTSDTPTDVVNSLIDITLADITSQETELDDEEKLNTVEVIIGPQKSAEFTTLMKQIFRKKDMATLSDTFRNILNKEHPNTKPVLDTSAQDRVSKKLLTLTPEDFLELTDVLAGASVNIERVKRVAASAKTREELI